MPCLPMRRGQSPGAPVNTGRACVVSVPAFRSGSRIHGRSDSAIGPFEEARQRPRRRFPGTGSAASEPSGILRPFQARTHVNESETVPVGLRSSRIGCDTTLLIGWWLVGCPAGLTPRDEPVQDPEIPAMPPERRVQQQLSKVSQVHHQGNSPWAGHSLPLIGLALLALSADRLCDATDK